MWRNNYQGWGIVSKLFHWLMAVLIAVQVGLGFYADNLALSPRKLDMFVWHKSLGILILSLLVIRLAWRLVNVIPHPAPVKRWQQQLAGATHWALYVLLFILPLSGWVVNSAAGVPLKLFWLVPLPPLTQTSESLEAAAGGVHEIGVAMLLVLLAVHIGAALWHHFVIGDNILKRMWFGETR